MRRASRYEDFARWVGLLDEEESFDGLAIAPDEGNGSFGPHRMEELALFCEQNPAFHIVTEIDDETGLSDYCLVNEARVVNRVSYYLARGSREPAIVEEAGSSGSR